MAEVTITSPAQLTNEVPEDGAANPWECHNFVYSILATETANYVSHIAWSLSGVFPVGISIDPLTGVISGQIKYFGEQPACTNNYPKETMLEDGSNRNDNGRLKDPFFIFVFDVTRKYNIKNPDTAPLADGSAPPATIIETVSKTFKIKVIKNHDIDNLLFVINYLKAGFTINVKGKKYNYSIVDELLLVHRGPFPKCTINTA